MVDKTDPSKGPMYSPCRGMDFELEMGIFIGGAPTELGEPVTMAEVEDHIFGLVVMNDWSARDIQKWEYVPLGQYVFQKLPSPGTLTHCNTEVAQLFISPPPLHHHPRSVRLQELRYHDLAVGGHPRCSRALPLPDLGRRAGRPRPAGIHPGVP
jgi:hypothetical protein